MDNPLEAMELVDWNRDEAIVVRDELVALVFILSPSLPAYLSVSVSGTVTVTVTVSVCLCLYIRGTAKFIARITTPLITHLFRPTAHPPKRPPTIAASQSEANIYKNIKIFLCFCVLNILDYNYI
jgi:hypothetical protein